MSIRYYDEALVDKIKRWVKDPNLQIIKPEESTRLFEMVADENKDQPLSLPLISISRDRSIEIINTQKQVKTFQGFNQSDKESINIPANVIPINVGYQIDIYTKGMIEADEYIRNFVFNFINYPRMKINIPYNNLNVEHVVDLYLDSGIADNSDIKEHLFADEFVRFTLKINLEGAYLFSLPKNQMATWASEEEVDEETGEVVNKVIIPGQLEVKDRYTKEVVEKTDIKY